jgi:transcriptional regulator with XRE-family HTH domain
MLTELRRKKGVTQAALAGLLGMPQSYVSKYELGERRVDLIEAFEICRVLDADPVAFVRKLIRTIDSEGAWSVASARHIADRPR